MMLTGEVSSASLQPNSLSWAFHFFHSVSLIHVLTIEEKKTFHSNRWIFFDSRGNWFIDSLTHCWLVYWCEHLSLLHSSFNYLWWCGASISISSTVIGCIWRLLFFSYHCNQVNMCTATQRETSGNLVKWIFCPPNDRLHLISPDFFFLSTDFFLSSSICPVQWLVCLCECEREWMCVSLLLFLSVHVYVCFTNGISGQ